MRTSSGVKVTDTVLGRDLAQDESDVEEGVMEGARARVALQGHSHLPGKLNKRKKPGIEESPRLP